MKSTFTDQNTDTILEKLRGSDASFSQAYPGDALERQPVHTVYGGAHLFRAGTAASLGAKALEALRRYAPDAATFGAAMGLSEGEAGTVYEKVAAKLEREPVEDYRIDFEDGYGVRTDAEEDREAELAARETALGFKNGTLPPFTGIRIKPLGPGVRSRAIRTLDIFLSTLLEETEGRLPGGFVVTLPKVTRTGEVSALAELLEVMESSSGLDAASLRIELMVETPQAIINARGEFGLAAHVDAAGGRCRGAHFGAYDYTASCNIVSTHQHLLHPACEYARQAMLAGLAQRGVFLADAPTNVIPVSREGDAAVVHRAWRLHFEHVRHALETGFYQGWDLHPAQLPSRFAAVYSFFLEALPAASARLKNFLAAAAQATLTGHVFDDAATGQGLLNFFLRGLGCGALNEDDIRDCGITTDELRTRSFLSIIERRRNAAH